MTDLIGKSLGRYHILEQLGEGGMAIVYKAYDTRLESDVAVKVIRIENLIPSTLERSRKRFEREAKALAKLTHSNIVKVLDYGEFEGKPYLVMPYLPGGTLKQKIQKKQIPYQDAARLLIPIAKALAFSHSQGMIHRDVKPANILITESGDPMLTDFGIAKILDEEATMDLTGTSAAVGTPEYMAPEQITSKTVDHRADIYSLGIVLYEMVTGRKPYQADTPMAVLFKHASEPLPRPKNFISSLPDEVEKILFKALQKKPEDRYANMDAFASALESVLGNNRQKVPKPVPKEKKQKSQFFTIAVKSIANFTSFISSHLRAFFSSNKKKYLLLFGGIILIVLLLAVLASKKHSPETYYTTLVSNKAEIFYFQKNINIPVFRSGGTSENWYPAPDIRGNLFFTSTTQSGLTEIFVLDASGKKSQFTHTPAPYSSWAPAPDLLGNLYFASEQEGGKTEIFAIDIQGKKIQVTHTPGNYESWSPVPDGIGNVYYLTNQDGNTEIFAIDSTGHKIQVTHTSENYESWSPAPDRYGNLYYVSNRDGNAEIFVVDSKGKNIQVTHTASKYQNWSPVPDDRGNLYFTSDRNGKTEIFIINSKGEVQLLAGIPSNSWLKEKYGNPSEPNNKK